MIDENESLLTLKQAASMLSVSEMSLRRWTNSGKLACVRVGTHRSRRFRREDLVQFLEKQDSNNKNGSDPSLQKDQSKCQAQILLEGISINYGSHLCSLYDDAIGRQKLMIPLLADGLRKGDICFLVATPKIQKEVLKELSETDCNVKSAKAKGQLLITDGESSMDEMLTFLRAQFTKATRSGCNSMRLVGDMSWALDKGWESSEIFAYEHAYNSTLGHQYPIVSLCLYDVNDFTGKGVLSALRTHEDTFNYPLNRFFGTMEHTVHAP